MNRRGVLSSAERIIRAPIRTRSRRAGAHKRLESANWCLRPDYRARGAVEPIGRGHLSCQSHVRSLAAHLAQRYDVAHILDIGPGSASPNLVVIRSGLDGDPGMEVEAVALPDDVLADSLIVCSGVIEHLVDPGPLLRLLSSWAGKAAAVLISTVERDLARGWGHLGPPADRGHAREWTLCEFGQLVDRAGLDVEFLGLTASNGDGLKQTTLAVCAGSNGASFEPAPKRFRVLAVMPALNEEDIIVPSVRALLDDGVEVHLIDHWSTDRTLERARSQAGRGRLTWEQFPSDGPRPTYRWDALLDRIDQVAMRSGADWCIYHGVNERRQSPWPDVGLRDALFRVQRRGFNAVDHTLLNFRPVDHGFRDGDDFERYFRYFTFGEFPGRLPHVTAWRSGGQPVRLADLGGRLATFPGRRVFPYNFLVKHYPVRSHSQGERKMRDRMHRSDPVERLRNWPVHEGHMTQDGLFRWDPAGLIEFDGAFSARYLTERLGNVGIRRSAWP